MSIDLENALNSAWPDTVADLYLVANPDFSNPAEIALSNSQGEVISKRTNCRLPREPLSREVKMQLVTTIEQAVDYDVINAAPSYGRCTCVLRVAGWQKCAHKFWTIDNHGHGDLCVVVLERLEKAKHQKEPKGKGKQKVEESEPSKGKAKVVNDAWSSFCHITPNGLPSVPNWDTLNNKQKRNFPGQCPNCDPEQTEKTQDNFYPWNQHHYLDIKDGDSDSFGTKIRRPWEYPPENRDPSLKHPYWQNRWYHDEDFSACPKPMDMRRFVKDGGRNRREDRYDALRTGEDEVHDNPTD